MCADFGTINRDPLLKGRGKLVSADVARARAGVTALFFTNGALFANFAPRFPELKDAFELTAGGYGLIIAAFPLGAIIGGPFAAKFVEHFTSAKVAAYGTFLIGIALTLSAILVAVAQGGGAILVVPFALLFALGGATDAIVDVGQNAHGLRVQKRYGRSIINSFHASWSLGAMTGGLMAMVATALAVPIGYHIGFAGVLFSIVALIASKHTLPGHDGEDQDEPSIHRLSAKNWSVPLVIALLLLLAISGVLVEDIAQSWSTLYMRDYLGASAALAPAAYVCMLAFHFLGRVTGDRFVDQLGAKRTILMGGTLIIVGMSAALLFQNIFVTVIAFAAAGFGAATTVPLAMNAADDVPGLKPGVGLMIVSWLMRLSFLLLPPFLGQAVVATSLLAPIVILPIGGVLVIVSTVVLEERKPVQD